MCCKRPTCSPAPSGRDIRYGRLDATDEEIVEAAKLVNAHDFHSHMENGYDSDVGEGGGQLSTGEKQLVSFARAILANPTFLCWMRPLLPSIPKPKP